MDEEKKEEQQVVEDTDADTKDIEQEQKDQTTELMERLTKMENAVTRLTGVVSGIQKAQSSMVDMGAVIRENPVDDTESDDDSFVPLEKLDFTI